MRPVVSVLCTTYNQRAYIEAALDGVLAQRTDFPFELIVRDDASTDGTREIVASCAERHPAVVRAVLEPVNRYRDGVKPVGAALAHARGEYIALCEGDDYWIDPLKLQSQVDILRKRPGVGLVHTDFDDLLRRGGRWRRFPAHHQRSGRDVPSGHVFEALLAGNFVQTCTVCLRTDAARAFFGGTLPLAGYPVGDWPLFLHVAAHHEIAYLPRATAVYRRTPASLMNSGTRARARTIGAYIPMIEDFAALANVDEHVRRSALKPLYRSLFSLSLLAGEPLQMQRAREWLRANDPAYLQPLRRRILPHLFKLSFAGGVLERVQYARSWIDDRMRFR
jgi:glycosyltransferase involved in cell wall biosynthesis